MATLFRNNWELLWTPNSDEINGDPRGLLRADNLTREEDGVLTLIRGTKKISETPATGTVTQIYSKIMDLQALSGDNAFSPTAKVRYLVQEDGFITRNWSPTQKREDRFDLAIMSGVTPTNIAAFGHGFGHVFICWGDQKKKDNGIKQTEIGLPQGEPPFPKVESGPQIVLSENAASPGTESYTLWELIENESVFNATATYLELDADYTKFQAIAILGLNNVINLNLLSFDGGTTETGTDDDIFTMNVRIGETHKFLSLKVAFILGADDAPLPLFQDNYYQFEWKNEWVTFNTGTNAWSNVKCRRKEFERMGTDDTLNWRNVRGIRVSFVNAEQSDQNFMIQSMYFKGSTNGPLDGQYTYVQVDVDNNGFFQEKSKGSAASIIVNPEKSTVKVKPTTVNPDANEAWIYRYGGGLSRYYLVKKITGSYGFDPAEFEDTVSDEQALLENEVLDEFQTNLPDGIIGMECNWKGRNWYITSSALYPSYVGSPSYYDSRYVVETGNKNLENNLFITRLNVDTMILATTKDFYEISGTGGIITQDQIDFFDLTIRPLGIKTPPISSDFDVREGDLFYQASDGVRILTGSSSLLLTQPIDLLFKGYNRYNIAPVRIEGYLKQRYYLKIAKNRLYYSTVQTDNKRALYVYSFEDKNWRYEEHGDTDSVMAIWAEEDDTLIYSTASFGDKFLRQLDVGELLNQTDPVNFKFLTVWDSNQSPRNRKDSFTLKLCADTGGSEILVRLRGGTELTTDGEMNQVKIWEKTVSFDGQKELQWPIYKELGLIKYYQLWIEGAVEKFKLYNFSVDYDERPVQLSVLRIPPTTYNVAARKRVYEIPFIIDTLGNDIYFTPVLDGVAKNPLVFNTTDKTLVSYMFPLEQAAFNVGAIIDSCCGDVFEFYELIQPREIEVLPDPIKFKFIPYNNLGSGSRKRFVQYAIVIDTRNADIAMRPVIDGIEQNELIVRTDRKQTVVYTFDHHTVGVDIACSLRGNTPFEFYEVNYSECVTEKLPPLARFLHIPAVNFNTTSRKRVRQFAFTINTFGKLAQFIPTIDGSSYPAKIFSTNRKQTVIYTFNGFFTGVDIGGVIESPDNFEFYGPSLEECVYEKLPPLATHLHIAYDNFNTTARKRIAQYAFVIDTFSKPVIFTPYVDGVIAGENLTFSTSRKETVVYTFRNSTTGVDIGGQLFSPGHEPFEFYGLALDSMVYEKLPPKVKSMEVSCTNFGTAGKKRIRTIPLVLDTFGHNVTYTPKVDGVVYPSSTFNTTGKSTVLHYFENESEGGVPFGIDYCGTLSSDYEFEFYEVLKPENVELLPVGKKFDQFGPLQFNRVGKIREIAVRMVHTGPSFKFTIFAQDDPIFKSAVPTVRDKEHTYYISCPKGINPNIFRMELFSDYTFHRFNAFVRLNIDGSPTENKWLEVK